MIREIVRDAYFLKRKSAKCTKADVVIARDLADTLRAHRNECVGMAANMIGISKRAIIVNTGMIDIIMFNPVITQKSSPSLKEEGCLSLAGVRPAIRYEHIEVEYMDISWHKRKMKASEWTAEIIQHECDHLEGILI